MAELTAQRMQELLKNKEYLQAKLYTNGFVISDRDFSIGDRYPFFHNWYCINAFGYRIYAHNSAHVISRKEENAVFFLIGHAVDPFSMLSDEKAILEKLSAAFHRSISDYYSAQNDLTGVYCTGVILENEIYFSNDCAGMQIVYYGQIEGHPVISSHSKLVGDLFGLKQSNYIERLVKSRFYHYMGTWLPGDLSPYSELRRLVPNHFVHWKSGCEAEVVRFFPTEAIQEIPDPDSYADTIQWLCDTVHNTLALYAKKWPGKIAISITGGRDSTTTLACAKGLYDKFGYFSYISNESERLDALAAKKICQRLELPHEIYEIPQNDADLPDTEAFAAVLECNGGCIGKNNPNDVRKRLYFIQNPKYDVEIKSWVNELGRGSQYVKYNKRRFPKKPNASYCRALHKVYVSPRLIHDTDKVFRAYLMNYYPEEVLQKAPWMELFWWEFCWSGGEGIFLTAEHRTSSEIAIPFNNRRYVAKMLTVPLEKRKADAIPKDMIARMNPLIAETGIVVKNLKHSNMRTILMRAYLEVFSKIRF